MYHSWKYKKKEFNCISNFKKSEWYYDYIIGIIDITSFVHSLYITDLNIILFNLILLNLILLKYAGIIEE